MGLSVAQRSLGQSIDPRTDIYIADTINEMGLFYRLCSVTFMGKTMPQYSGVGGGQNPIEPAQLGCTLIFGPDMSNFAAVCSTLLNVGAAVQVSDEDELATQVGRLLLDGPTCDKMAQSAATVSQAEAGVIDRVMSALNKYFEGDDHARA